MPKPELYVIFTGNKGKKPDQILLSEEFFKGIFGTERKGGCDDYDELV